MGKNKFSENGKEKKVRVTFRDDWGEHEEEMNQKEFDELEALIKKDEKEWLKSLSSEARSSLEQIEAMDKELRKGLEIFFFNNIWNREDIREALKARDINSCDDFIGHFSVPEFGTDYLIEVLEGSGIPDVEAFADKVLPPFFRYSKFDFYTSLFNFQSTNDFTKNLKIARKFYLEALRLTL